MKSNILMLLQTADKQLITQIEYTACIVLTRNK
jgi:hypothetical protein